MVMTTETMPVQLPEALYRGLERLAALTHRSVESLIVRTLASSIPPFPDDLPAPTRDALTVLEGLRDAELWQMLHSTFPEAQYEHYAELRGQMRGRWRSLWLLLPEALIGIPLEFDHLYPEALGGPTEHMNLWLACTRCNVFNSGRLVLLTSAIGQTMRLFPFPRFVYHVV